MTDNTKGQQTVPVSGETVSWMRLDAAAKRVGVHPRTLRRQIIRGKIVGEQPKPPKGPWMVTWESVDRLYRQTPQQQSEPEQSRSLVPASLVADLTARYDELTRQQQQHVIALQGQVTDLRVALARTEAVLGWSGRRRLRRLQADR